MSLKALGSISWGKDAILQTIILARCAMTLVLLLVSFLKKEHVNSIFFMSHSAGNRITAAIAECMDIPYYSKVVEGKLIFTETLYYKQRGVVEDLFDLLSNAKVR